ncbi:MAG: leucine-rich repeat domain-containing protein, partial [Oscillospiraceae bacterium]|nr:leucine-rich repeat domain-containing protein [Oscillospiraceae bacterium]
EGGKKAREPYLRDPTPPMNFSDAERDEYPADLTKTHTFTYTQFEVENPAVLVFWPDVILRDFAFVSLDVAGHYYDENGQLIIGTQEILYTIDEFLPGEGFVLNVAFSHYLIPHGAIIFTDEQGAKQRMFIRQHTRGGCYPEWSLEWANEFEQPVNPLESGLHAVLEEVVLVELPAQNITDEQLAELIASGEIPQNVTNLYLWGNQISDVTPISNLTNLRNLTLGENQITDISPLSELTNLTLLGLNKNPISDISPLGHLTNLTKLGLDDVQLDNLSPLVNLTNLEYLNLSDTQIIDLSPLSELTNLNILNLRDNQISDITALEGLSNLESLVLWGNQISDISPLANLTNLIGLSLNGNKISDISPLANLTNLEHLGLSDNQISDITPISNLTNLTNLYLQINQISDVSTLSGLSSLEWLGLWSNPISNEQIDELRIALPECNIDF